MLQWVGKHLCGLCQYWSWSMHLGAVQFSLLQP